MFFQLSRRHNALTAGKQVFHDHFTPRDFIRSNHQRGARAKAVGVLQLFGKFFGAGVCHNPKASGAQARDAACRNLRLSVTGGRTLRESGADERLANDEAANRRCWGL